EVTLVGSAKLAALAEAELRGTPATDAAIAQEIAPCFIDEGGRRTDTVVLACTHFPLLLERLERLAPWPVSFIDPAPAIARRIVELIGPATTPAVTAAEIAFTAGKPPTEALAATLNRFGLASTTR